MHIVIWIIMASNFIKPTAILYSCSLLPCNYILQVKPLNVVTSMYKSLTLHALGKCTVSAAGNLSEYKYASGKSSK